ncbi:GPI-anchored surface protein, putative [Bodo saltans]|uniref:GPI-anchored surface protein, putative n=1 Tax=Bodo saltans TaxID=75058 RepID=A0A0S4KHL2_BODSA|nr:GPI-anchored surface protein, putative [Bodo saltans]|eukprot:CUI13035.1 GPI-anchored surface protein, putative [Bodo saltans]
MRSISVGQALVAFCAVMSVALWLGARDVGSRRSSVTSAISIPSQGHDYHFDHTAATSTMVFTTQDHSEVSPSASGAHWQWTGGGVRGLSEGEENVALDNVSAALRAAFIDLFHVPMHLFDIRHLSRAAPHTITRFRRLFMSFAVNRNHDCMVRMDPYKQLQCHLWANKLNNNNNVRTVGGRSVLFSGTPAHSMCSLALSCSLWKRGRHGTQLTPALLQGVFRTLKRDDELRNSSQLMLRNVIHGGSNWHEYQWLPNRLKVCEELIVGSTPPSKTPIVDARALFQGGDLTIDQRQAPSGFPVKRLATRDNGSARKELTRTLTALEAMSVLYHRATNGGRPQLIVYPATSTLRECRTTAINMLLVSGDSIARQLFWRVVELLRRGPQGQVRVPYASAWVATSFRHFPVQRYYKWMDVVLAIYPGHDELHVFEPLMPHDTVFHGAKYKRSSTNTVHTFFAKTAAERQRQCNNNNTMKDEPLFYIVYLFDAITARPRTDALAPCLPAIPFSTFPLPTTNFAFAALQRAVAQGMTLIHDPPIPSFRALGIRIPLHVHNANAWDLDESPTTYKWLERMATQCNVTTASVLPPPSVSTTLATQQTSLGAVERNAEHSSQEWIVGEHPPSDMTHLYRVETQLKHTDVSTTRLRVAPVGRKEITVNEGHGAFHPSDYRLTRLETPFVWLRNTTAKQRDQNHQCENAHRPGVFFSKIRLLDMGKVMLASGNAIHTPDQLHEDCYGSLWLAGAAMYKKSSQSHLRQWSKSMKNLAVGLMQHQFDIPGYHAKFSFHPDSDCGAVGTLMTVNALLIDIIMNGEQLST